MAEHTKRNTLAAIIFIQEVGQRYILIIGEGMNKSSMER